MATSATKPARLELETYDIGLLPPALSPRSRLRRVLGWVLLLLVFTVVLELTCRIEDWMMYRMPLTSRYTSLNDLVVRDADGMHGRPSARFEKWVMNSLGTRGPEASLIPARATVRVFAVGASETFGLRESPGREFPRQLEDSLNARVARGECASSTGSAPLRFEVLNAAFAGMSLPTIDQDIRNRLRRMRPDFIFAYPSPAQYLDEEIPTPASPDSSHRDLPPSPARALYPRSADRIREQVKVLLPEWFKSAVRGLERRGAVGAHPAGWQFTQVPSERVARFDADLRSLFGTIRATGAEPVVATHANLFMDREQRDAYALVAWEKFYPRASGSTIIAFDSVAREITMRAGADSNVVIVDAARRLAAAPPSAFADFVHFTDFGSSDMAQVGSAGIIEAARRAGRCQSSEGESGSTAGAAAYADRRR